VKHAAVTYLQIEIQLCFLVTVRLFGGPRLANAAVAEVLFLPYMITNLNL